MCCDSRISHTYPSVAIPEYAPNNVIPEFPIHGAIPEAQQSEVIQELHFMMTDTLKTSLKDIPIKRIISQYK